MAEQCHLIGITKDSGSYTASLSFSFIIFGGWWRQILGRVMEALAKLSRGNFSPGSKAKYFHWFPQETALSEAQTIHFAKAMVETFLVAKNLCQKPVMDRSQ